MLAKLDEMGEPFAWIECKSLTLFLQIVLAPGREDKSKCDTYRVVANCNAMSVKGS